MPLFWSPAHWQQLSALWTTPFCHTIVTATVRPPNPPQPPLPVEGASAFIAPNLLSTNVPASAWGMQGKPLSPKTQKKFWKMNSPPKSGALITLFRVFLKLLESDHGSPLPTHRKQKLNLGRHNLKAKVDGFP